MIFLPSSTFVPSSRTTSGTFEAGFLDRGDDALGDHVAFHDPAENIHQNAFDLGVGGDDLERFRHSILGGAAADIEEIRRRTAIELDDIHRRHGKPGAIDHAADRAGERDIVQIVFRRLDFPGVFFAFVAQGGDLWMPVKRVSIERHLGVEAFDPAFRRNDQRIDFKQRHVLGDEGRVELRGQFSRLFGEIAGKAQGFRDGAAMVRHDPRRRIDRETDDPVRRLMRHLLDIHAAFGRNHESDTARGAIDKQG